MSGSVVLAVDGGNSKTDLALVRDDGALLAHVRGPLSSPHHLGLEGALGLLEGILDEALVTAGSPTATPVADVAELFLAGVDFPRRRSSCATRSRSARWAARPSVGNDTFAVLRAGTGAAGASRSCAAPGSTASASRPTAASRAFPRSVRSRATGAAATTSGSPRSPPPRAARTGVARRRRSSSAVPAHFGFETPLELAEAIHAGRDPARRLIELAPLVLDVVRDRRCRGRDRRPAGGGGRRAGAVGARRGSGSSTSPPTSCSAAGCSRPGRPAARRDRRRPPRARPAARRPADERRRRSSAPRCSGSTRSAPGPRPTSGRGASSARGRRRRRADARRDGARAAAAGEAVGG